MLRAEGTGAKGTLIKSVYEVFGTLFLKSV
jgi:hypothetical protein